MSFAYGRSNVVGLKAVLVEVAADSISTSSVHIVRCRVASDASTFPVNSQVIHCVTRFPRYSDHYYFHKEWDCEERLAAAFKANFCNNYYSLWPPGLSFGNDKQGWQKTILPQGIKQLSFILSWINYYKLI